MNDRRTRRSDKLRLFSVRVLAICIIVLPGAGCARSDGSPGPDAAAPTPQTPLESILAIWRQRQTRQQDRVEAAIAACMNRRGFPFVPGVNELRLGEAPAYTLSSEEFRGQFGYGIVTPIGHEAAFTAPTAENPNEKIAASLSKTRRRAYDAALWGRERDAVLVTDQQTGEALAEWFPDSCVTQANAEVHGSRRDAVESSLSVNRLLARLHTRITTDPRVVEVKQAWTECMATRGQQRFEEPNDIRAHLLRQRERLPRGRPTAATEDRVAEMQQLELVLAAADQSCRDDIGLSDVMHEVRTEYELAFVAGNAHLIQHVWPIPRSELTRIIDGAAGHHDHEDGTHSHD